MNLIVNEGDVVSLHKHPIGLFAQDVSQILEPLKKSLGITYFGYGRVYGPGEESFLTNNPRFSEDFFNNQLYKVGFMGEPKNYKSGYSLLDALPENDIVALSRERHHMGHFLVILKQQGSYCEKLFFATSSDAVGMSNVYLNNLSVFQGFTEYFKERAAGLIQQSDQLRTVCTSLQCQETLLTQSFEHQVVELPASSFLTIKERECAFYLAQCLSLKEVAEGVGISPRTLEKHIAKLKAKLGCKNMSSLVVQLRKYFL